MSLAANSKPSSAEELLMARRRKRQRVREAGHARCLQHYPRVLPRPRALTFSAPRARTSALGDINDNDLETASLRLHAPLRTLHRVPRIAHPPPFPSVFVSGNGSSASANADPPPLGPTHPRRLPWAKLTPILLLSRAESARIQMARKHSQRDQHHPSPAPMLPHALLHSPAPPR
ncbi:hypothetical protein FIBSPDRAFT_1051151 [Athelia psychrophila]|uniref:Uncharacterized protein n=1 Tax=Athelia psychrophila TaxID=1759441 RepID=A0A165ZNW3_9AGAM|nr:hypothetical protein FIBSPDRAFT_1051151 [Fibularhizoctonia sp. CBS 109695]